MDFYLEFVDEIDKSGFVDSVYETDKSDDKIMKLNDWYKSYYVQNKISIKDGETLYHQDLKDKYGSVDNWSDNPQKFVNDSNVIQYKDYIQYMNKFKLKSPRIHVSDDSKT